VAQKKPVLPIVYLGYIISSLKSVDFFCPFIPIKVDDHAFGKMNNEMHSFDVTKERAGTIFHFSFYFWLERDQPL
jgi:hypothetical protein